MAPTLLPEERVLVDRLAYRRENPQRGDVVLASHPQDKKRLLLKRVAALPGEQVRLTKEGTVINDTDLYAMDISVRGGYPPGATWQLGAQEYFLLGDSADLSTDSRAFGAVRREAIRGKAWLVYWPPSRRRRVV